MPLCFSLFHTHTNENHRGNEDATKSQLCALECIELTLNSQFTLRLAARADFVVRALAFDYQRSSARVAVMALRLLSVIAFHSLEGHWYV